MAIYHLETKIVSRGAGRSAVAAAAYLSCSRMLNEYDGVQHDYTRKQDLGWRQVFLPATAPAEWQEAESRAQEAYGEKYNPLLMFDSKKAVSRMLHEDMERQAMRRMVRQAQKEQQIFNKGKRKDQGRDVR